MKKLFKVLVLSFVIVSYSTVANAEDSTVTTAAEVSFDKVISLEYNVGITVISDEHKEHLNKIVGFMKENPESTVRITGHTDQIGTPHQQENKARARVENVINYLIEQDISRDRIFFASSGGRAPIAPNDTEEGRKRNRRVEILINR